MIGQVTEKLLADLADKPGDDVELLINRIPIVTIRRIAELAMIGLKSKELKNETART